MDLVALMKKEIAELHLVDKRDIQNHLYQRIGELFEYDPYWKFASVLEQYKIANRKIDVHNVTNFYAVCFAIAPMAIKLLKEFGISAREEGNVGHAYVVTTIDGKDYKFDLTKGFEDFMRIKFGLKIQYHYDSPSHNDNRKYKNTEKGLYQIKKKLQSLMPKMDKDEYIYQVFLTINKILTFYEPDNVDIVTGVEFVNYLLKDFIGENYLVGNTRFFNQENWTFVEVYSIIVKGKIHYFLYQKIEKKYELFETTEEKIKEIIDNYKPDNAGNLIVLKGQPSYLKFKKIEEPLRKLKKELRVLANKYNEEEYIYQTFKAIQKIIVSFAEEDRTVEMLDYLIRYLIGENQSLDCTRFVDSKSQELIEFYFLSVNGFPHYFFYQKINGKYELFETSENYVRNIENIYEKDTSEKLILSKGKFVYKSEVEV